MTGCDAASSVPRLVDELLARPARLGSTRLVALDGRAGSGKTTAAAEMEHEVAKRAVAPGVLHLDDLYDGWAGLNATLPPRVLAQVLEPLAAGRPARWQRYDWHSGRFAEWIDLDPPGVLILEGCGSGARAYAPYRSLLVWLEAPAPVRRARALERDGDIFRRHWSAWAAEEARHYAAEGTADRADLVVFTG